MRRSAITRKSRSADLASSGTTELFVVRRILLANELLDRREIRAPHRLLVDAIERRLPEAIVRQHGEIDRAVAGAEDEDGHVGRRVAFEPKSSRALFVRYAFFLQEHRDAVGTVIVGLAFFGEPSSLIRVLLILVIVAAIAGLKLFG